jgi:hypothetical protein
MTTITTRSGKGSPLTNDEVDANFTGLNDDKVETSGDSMTGNLSFGDNNKVILGSGSDLQLYHDANNSFIKDSGTGSLYVQADAGVYITNASGSENKAIFTSDGAVNLYHDNALRFVTTSSGIDVTGVITTDGMTTSADINFGDNDKAVFGAGSDLQIYHDGSHSYIQDSGTGDLIIRAENFRLTDSGNTEFMLQAVPNGAVTAYFNGSAKIATTNTGIDVTGGITAENLTLNAGTPGPHLSFENVGGSTRIKESTGGNFYYSAYTHVFEGHTGIDRLKISQIGDISFYNSAGNSQDLYWDASTSRLGLGTNLPSNKLDVKGTVGFEATNSTNKWLAYTYTDNSFTAELQRRRSR